MAEHSMNWIEAKAKDFAEKRAELACHIEAVEAEIKLVKDFNRARIKQLVAETADAHAGLSTAILESPSLFEKPKTRLLHGIKLGFRKEPGKVSFENAGHVVKLIRKHLPDEADVLIKVSETPVKSALSQLTGAELKKIGVTITDSSDAVLIKPADSEIDKWIDALLADDGEIQNREVA